MSIPAWCVRTPGGEVLQAHGDTLGPARTRKPFPYFFVMHPVDQVVWMVRLSFTKLRVRGMQLSTAGKLLKVIWAIVLATRYGFGARADLWVTKARNKYKQTSAFG